MRFCALALLLAGCGGAGIVSLQLPATAPPAADYVDELKKWTRGGHVIADFDEALSVKATFRSPEFRAAYAEKWIKVFRVGAADAALTREHAQSDNAGTWEFHVESTAHLWEANEFTGKKSLWRIALVEDGGREVAVKDVILTLQRRQVEMDFYPYAGTFSRGWTLRFPKTLADGTPLVRPETRTLTLRFAGPLGDVDLVWTLQ